MAVREYRWDNLKAVMIIGIVLEHTLLIYGYPRSMELLWASCISWLMPLFTVISGYWFKKRTIKELCNKYLYPMLLFSAINFIIGYFFYTPYHKGVHLMGYAMWYLWALFIFAIITPRLICLVRLKWLILCSFIAVVLYGLIPLSGHSLHLANELQINRIIGFYPFFLLGVMLKDCDLIGGKNNLPILAVVFIIYVLLCLMINGLAYYSGFYLIPDMSIRKFAYIFLSYTLIGLFCLYLIRSVPNKNCGFTRYGARSMNVYLLHMLFVFPMSYGVFSHLPVTPVFVVLNVIGVPLLCMSLFLDKVEAIMSAILSKRSRILVVVLYLFSIVLVNHTWLFDF